MKGLLQDKLSGLEFLFGILIAVAGGIVKTVSNNGGISDSIKSGFMGFFVSVISGLVFVEYFNSPTIIVASMGLSGYSGAAFLDSIHVLGRTLSAFKEALEKPNEGGKL